MKLFRSILQFAAAITLALSVLFPTAIKMLHTFSGHEHVECLEHGTTHFHKSNLDCEIYKFKLNSHNYYLPAYNSPTVAEQLLTIKNFSNYFYLSEYQALHFSLRGPPVSQTFPFESIFI